MTRWLYALVALVAFAIGADVISHVTYERRKQERAILEDRWDEYAQKVATGRVVDIGVRLCCVVQDDSLLGHQLVPGKPRVRVIKVRELGGLLDRKKGKLVSSSRAPRIWFCSEDQWDVVLHSDDLPLAQLVYGSEGAGKTTALAQWHYCRWLEHLGEKREGGQTAPTKERLSMVREEMVKLFAPTWYKYLKSKDIFRFVDGTRIRFRATKQQSKDAGSPIQGFNWSWCGRDEVQDQIERHDDIENRGREARDGRYKQCATATAKDTSAWRSFRDQLLSVVDGKVDWIKRTLLGRRSPFVHQSFWEAKKRKMSPREYKRRVLAEDVPPELAVYYTWERERNLVAYPQIAIDVTPAVLSGYQSYVRAGARFSLLAGHDPGAIYNTTVFLRLIMFGAVPTWIVVGEVQTPQTTQRDHARAVKKYVQETFGIERGPSSSKVAIFADPHGKGTAQTDYQSVYMAFQKEGLDIFSPAATEGRINRAPRIELINRLLFSEDSSIRLRVACDHYRQPLAPHLVSAFESLEKRPGDDNPEGARKKDEHDQTHAPAACAYALWQFEQEAFTDHTIAAAMAEARRIRVL